MSRSSFPPHEDDFTRALLRSAENDEPSSAAYVKAAAALGVGVGLGVSASLPAPAALAAAAAGVGGAVRWSGAVVARLLALGVSSVLLVGGGVVLVRGHQAAGGTANPANLSAARAVVSPATAMPSPTSSPSAAAFGTAHEATSNSPGSPPGANVLPDPVTVAAPRLVSSSSSAPVARRHPRRPNAVARESSKSSLAAEVQSLDRARVALGLGDASTALHEIASYRSTWPQGVFLTEASVLEIEALAARGERSLAAQRASAFVAAHPDSPQSGRLRRLIPPEMR